MLQHTGDFINLLAITLLTRNSSLDLKDKIIDADILDAVMGSDHCPVKLVLEI